MISAFICANIYGLLYVCQIRTTQISKKEIVYEVLLTDNKWYKVNRCTAQKASVSRPFKARKNTTFCT